MWAVLVSPGTNPMESPQVEYCEYAAAPQSAGEVLPGLLKYALQTVLDTRI